MSQHNAAAVAAPELPHSDSLSFSEKDVKDSLSEEKKVDVESHSVIDEDVGSEIIKKDEDVAIEVSILHVVAFSVTDAGFGCFQVISSQDDPELPVFTFRTVFLGIGLSAFTSVLSTIYTFKPQVRCCSSFSELPEL